MLAQKANRSRRYGRIGSVARHHLPDRSTTNPNRGLSSQVLRVEASYPLLNHQRDYLRPEY